MAKFKQIDTADRLAARLLDDVVNRGGLDIVWLRDMCDLATGSDLDCFQLDMLTDMTRRRIQALRQKRVREAVKGERKSKPSAS